ncbi:hypothetical protein ACJMK2_003874 [Sinanodonta woodiana]|uniref:SNRNP25 ubiquitin-like domain-containing protein n=1 Tax=Sinanodonta woodiana TaxID=1069815 RepID=A0ABD3XZH8_SINWO
MSAEKPVHTDSGAMNHREAMEKIKQVLNQLVTSDPLLCDLPSEVTPEEINSQIALEYGQAMVVNVRRSDDVIMPIVITQNATVLDLKHAIQRYVNLKQVREGGKQHISWRYVWKRHWLYFNSQKLTDDNKKLKDYEIRNKDEVTFVKRLKEK